MKDSSDNYLSQIRLGDDAVAAEGVLVVSYAADLVGGDDTGDRILDFRDGAFDAGVDIDAVLEGAVAGLVEGAVLQDDPVHIAQRLLAGDVATHKPYVLRMPGEILPVKHRVVDRDILALPERILSQNIRVMHLHVLAVLEYILRIALQPVHIYIAAEHERIRAVMKDDILQPEIIDLPERLVGIIDRDILKRQPVHLAEKLRTVDDAVLHGHIIAVPDRRPRSRCEVTIPYNASVNVPQRVLAVKLASGNLDVGTTLYSGLSIRNGNILQSAVADTEQRPLSAEGGVFNYFHSYFAIL